MDTWPFKGGDISLDFNVFYEAAQREQNFMFDKVNWKAINASPKSVPFLVDAGGHSAFLSAVGSSFTQSPFLRRHGPVSAFEWQLDKICGFPVSALDLSRSAITGSSFAFAASPCDQFLELAPTTHLSAEPTPPEGMCYFRGHGREPICVEVDQSSEFDPAESRLSCKVRGILMRPLDPESRREPGEIEAKSSEGWIKPTYDIDIAVLAPGALDEEAHKHFTALQKLFPSIKLVKIQKAKGHSWKILPQSIEDFKRLPPVEIYQSCLATICSHHLPPVRGCYTAYAGLDAEPLEAPRALFTLSALRAYNLRLLSNFNYFASRKTFPQEIILKYLSRRYRLDTTFMSHSVYSELLGYIRRHPSLVPLYLREGAQLFMEEFRAPSQLLTDPVKGQFPENAVWTLPHGPTPLLNIERAECLKSVHNKEGRVLCFERADGAREWIPSDGREEESNGDELIEPFESYLSWWCSLPRRAGVPTFLEMGLPP